MTPQQLLPSYLEQVKPTPTVREAILQSWPKFVAFCDGRELASLPASALEDFQKRLLWEPSSEGRFYKPNTVDQFLRRVRQILRWAFEQGHLPHDLTRCFLLPRPPQPQPVLLSWGELERIWQTADTSTAGGQRDLLLLRLVCETDLAVRDCLSLSVENALLLDLEPDTKALVESFGSQSRLFLGANGQRWNDQCALIALRRLTRQAGLVGVTARHLRRSYRAHLDRQAKARHFFP